MGRMIRSAFLGVVAGALGTLAMDLVWFRRYRSSGGEQKFTAWETSEGTTDYETAAAPARTAQAVAHLAGVELPDSSARAVNNAVHWLTGMAWGKAHALASLAFGWSNPVAGLGTAVVAWGTSYVVLPRLGVYQRFGEYEPDVLWQDLSAHLVYGSALGLTYWSLSSRP